MPFPVVSAGGFCIGSGSEIAAACYFRICEKNARIGQPESTFGILPASTVKICFAAEKYRNNHIIQVLLDWIPENLTLERVICFMDKLPENAPDCFITENEFRNGFCGEECGWFVPEADHTMSLACTSGSTGIPKILSVPYYGFLVSQMDMGSYLDFTSDDIMMIGMTLYHQGGFGMGLQMTLKGGTVLYQPQFQPVTFLETVQKYRITVIQLTSTLTKVLLSTPNFDSYDLSSVRICYFAGEVLPKELADIFVKKLNSRVINIISSSKNSTMVVWDCARDGEVDPSDFRKLPFTDQTESVGSVRGSRSAAGGWTSAVCRQKQANHQARQKSRSRGRS